jgi:hypothetical protein
MLTSLTIRLRALYQEPWRFCCLHNAVVIIQWFLPLTRAFTQHSPVPSSSFLPLAACLSYEICLQNQNQAGESSKYHCRHRRILLRIPCVDCDLLSKPLSQCLLRYCSGNHRLLGPPSCPLLMAQSTIMDAPGDEATAAIAPPNHHASSISSQGIPLVLQISSLPGSLDPDEFFYDPYATLESGNFCSSTCVLDPSWSHCHLPQLPQCHGISGTLSLSKHWLHLFSS